MSLSVSYKNKIAKLETEKTRAESERKKVQLLLEEQQKLNAERLREQATAINMDCLKKFKPKPKQQTKKDEEREDDEEDACKVSKASWHGSGDSGDYEEEDPFEGGNENRAS